MAKMKCFDGKIPFWTRIVRWFTGYPNKEAIKRAHWRGYRMKTVMLFSGRFDRVHPGHIITIQRLGQQYDVVIVCVLDYGGQRYSLESRMATLRDALMNSRGSYVVMSNKVHFGRICFSDLDELPRFTHYGSGNREVLGHMREIIPKEKVVFVERYPGYSASEEC